MRKIAKTLFCSVDIHTVFMHDTCMATKTISLELDAYEKLKRCKRNPRESFSSVVRRVVWADEASTAGTLLQLLKKKMAQGDFLPEEDLLDRLDEAQESPRVSRAKW